MLRFVHSLSAWFFYPLAGSFFVVYLLLRHNTATAFAEWWLHVMDLPLLLAGVLYGASSVIISVTEPERPSWGIIISVVLPAALILIAALSLTFISSPAA